jgi:hypothetical protein
MSEIIFWWDTECLQKGSSVFEAKKQTSILLWEKGKNRIESSVIDYLIQNIDRILNSEHTDQDMYYFIEQICNNIDPQNIICIYEESGIAVLWVKDIYTSIMRKLVNQSNVLDFNKLKNEEVSFNNWLHFFLIELRRKIVEKYVGVLEKQWRSRILTSKAFEYTDPINFNRNKTYRIHVIPKNQWFFGIVII